MICIKNAKRYCKEDISLIENYDKAINDKEHNWECHHRDEVKLLPSGIIVKRTKQELIENCRYYKCPANELIFLNSTEHQRLHKTGRVVSEETKIKLSKSIQSKYTSEFSMKFNEHYGINRCDNKSLYNREFVWYIRHNHKCRWE